MDAQAAQEPINTQAALIQVQQEVIKLQSERLEIQAEKLEKVNNLACELFVTVTQMKEDIAALKYRLQQVQNHA